MENSLLVIFDKIPCTIVQGALSNLGANLKIHKKSKFDLNQLKLVHNISTCTCIIIYKNKCTLHTLIRWWTLYSSYPHPSPCSRHVSLILSRSALPPVHE